MTVGPRARAPAPLVERAGGVSVFLACPAREEEDAEDKHAVWARGLCTGLSARSYLRAAGEHFAICWLETMRCLTAITWMNMQEEEQRGGVLSGATS